jgi:hypothetical protein
LDSLLFKDFCFLLEILDLTPIKSERQLYDAGYKSNQTMHCMVRVDILLGTKICSGFVHNKINFYFCQFQIWLQVLHMSKKWTLQNSVVIPWMAVTLWVPRKHMTRGKLITKVPSTQNEQKICDKHTCRLKICFKVLEMKQSFYRAQNTAQTRLLKFYNSAEAPCFFLVQNKRPQKIVTFY